MLSYLLVSGDCYKDKTTLQKEEVTVSIRKVVINDGDAFMRMCTKRILVENGFEVAEADNGVEVIWESQPDMVLMNISKPVKDNLTT